MTPLSCRVGFQETGVGMANPRLSFSFLRTSPPTTKPNRRPLVLMRDPVSAMSPTSPE